MKLPEKVKSLLEKLKLHWRKIDGKKTYLSAIALLALQVINLISPDTIPTETYELLKYYMEILLYGSASHGAYKVLRKQPNKK